MLKVTTPKISSASPSLRSTIGGKSGFIGKSCMMGCVQRRLTVYSMLRFQAAIHHQQRTFINTGIHH